MSISIHLGELDQEDVQALLALHVAAMHAHSPPEACHVLPGSALAHPAITFFTAREAGRLLGIGALKELGGGEGEIKSMRTAPSALGGGVGRTILAAITAEARSRGYSRLLLETGRSEHFAAANHLYDRAGFTECGQFGGYPASDFTRFLCLEL
ncbi:GNAT family N-acetyltransferase [Sphingomonas glaciei]|uniref:GNAT family N-acetyltransferase n=1 Tax=Sphingomonas glaciei TaxID=2938948 RepID=A0ABY5MZ89_9SPHN|nr:GNAT family N-acetyltransferase [Sphingomonas glaciei]UUR08388.1 GNAT family N-acetyltransferase [Sphingomonas glaciei]